jgi:hypothetical protein
MDWRKGLLTSLLLLQGRMIEAYPPSYTSVRLDGQLGNQMFEIATAYAYAKDRGFQLTVPDLEELKIWGTPENRRTMFRKISADRPAGVHFHPLKELSFSFRPLPTRPDARLEGFFQSEKFFVHRRPEILELYRPESEDFEAIFERYPQLQKEPVLVGVQCRYYLREVSASYHPTFGRKFYEEAFKKMPSEALFVVSSDRIEWVKQLFRGLPYRFLFLEGQSYYRDMITLTQCHHFVISNSTFGWWAAWLSEASNKRVVAPMPWFGRARAHYNLRHLLPKDWEVIECPQAILRGIPENQ